MITIGLFTYWYLFDIKRFLPLIIVSFPKEILDEVLRIDGSTILVRLAEAQPTIHTKCLGQESCISRLNMKPVSLLWKRLYLLKKKQQPYL